MSIPGVPKWIKDEWDRAEDSYIDDLWQRHCDEMDALDAATKLADEGGQT